MDKDVTSSALPTDMVARRRSHQTVLGGMLVVLIVIGVGMAVSYSRRSSSPASPPGPATPLVYDDPLGRVDPTPAWRASATARLDKQDATLETLAAQLTTLQQTVDKTTTVLLTQQAALSEAITTPTVSGETPITEPALPVAASPVLPEQERHLVTVEVPLDMKRLPKTPQTYVPAGSFVQTVMLGGLDASASVTASSDPRPAILRVTEKGSLPGKTTSPLIGCRLIGAAFGDISSERAYLRLERLSCLHDGVFHDFQVTGYATGPDGKDGIRGRVVLRDAAMAFRAFAGGFLGGLGKSIANKSTVNSVSADGAVATIDHGMAFQYAGSQGVTDAMDLMARYYMKRAEQYQPVIEIAAGTAVDVVFTHGFYLDGFEESPPGKLAGPTVRDHEQTFSHVLQEAMS